MTRSIGAVVIVAILMCLGFGALMCHVGKSAGTSTIIEKAHSPTVIPVKEWLAGLRDENPKIRNKTAAKLQGMGDSAITPLIDQGLSSNDPTEREDAETAIAYIIGGKSAWTQSIEALDDDRANVSVSAERVLTKLSGAEQAVDIANKANETAKTALERITQTHQVATEANNKAEKALANSAEANSKAEKALANSAEAKTSAETSATEAKQAAQAISQAKADFKVLLDQEKQTIAKANKLAENAYLLANEAKSKIDNYGTNSEVAKEAKTIALEALKSAKEATLAVTVLTQAKNAAAAELKKAETKATTLPIIVPPANIPPATGTYYYPQWNQPSQSCPGGRCFTDSY